VRKYDVRWLIVYLANLLVWWLAGLANNYLGRFAFLWFDHVSLHLYVGGLFVVYSALRLDRKHGLVAIVLTGLTIDAAGPVPFGTSLFLLGLVHATLLYGRQRFPREGAVFGIVVALLANLFLFIVLSFLLVGANPRPGEAWLRIFADLLASQGVLVLITPWFLALQDRAMELVRIHPETGRRVQI
jgi:rod shape-determining protein MreD